MQSRGGIARHFRGPAVVLAAFLAISASPAAAQVGAVVSVFSDSRFRGISLSDGRPVGILDLSYDASNGLYAAVSGSVVDARHEGLRALSVALNGGYAKRLRSGLTGDVGIVHSRYSHYSGVASGRAYTEVYAGVAGKLVGTRLSVSPNYLGGARWTAHDEIDGHLDLSTRLQVDGEVGVLIPFGGRANGGNSRAEVDARVGVTQRVGRLAFHAALTANSGSSDIYADRGHARTALVVGISSAF